MAAARKFDRQKAKQEVPAQPHALIAVVRKSKSGHMAIIEIVGKDEITATVTGATLAQAVESALAAMVADMASIGTVKLLVEGTR